MWKQTTVFGETLEIPENLKEVCCSACYNANEPVCVCQCHGAYHGLGNKNRKYVSIDTSYEKVLPEDEAAKFRDQYDFSKTRDGGVAAVRCLCGYNLKDEPIVYYTNHDAGWTVEGEETKCWLYVKCPKCGYDMSIWKMGVPRE